MDAPARENSEGVPVVGFEFLRSPESSYNNPIPGIEEEAQDPPLVPPHLHSHVMGMLPNQDAFGSAPVPQNVILNHLYIENRESPRSVLALGITHRYRAKYVTLVLYKPVQRR